MVLDVRHRKGLQQGPQLGVEHFYGHLPVDANTRFVAMMSKQIAHLGHKTFHAQVGKTNAVKPRIHLPEKAWCCALNAAARENLPPLLFETLGECVKGGRDAANAKKNHWEKLALYQEPNVLPVKFSANRPINPSLCLLPNLNKGPISASRGACHLSKCLGGGANQEMLNWCHVSVLKWDPYLESQIVMVCVVAPSIIGHLLEQYKMIKILCGLQCPP
jgi:hypothetical protein